MNLLRDRQCRRANGEALRGTEAHLDGVMMPSSHMMLSKVDLDEGLVVPERVRWC